MCCLLYRQVVMTTVLISLDKYKFEEWNLLPSKRHQHDIEDHDNFVRMFMFCNCLNYILFVCSHTPF